MNTTRISTYRPLAAATAAAFLIGGCVSAPPRVQADRDVQRATGMPPSVVLFRSVGEPDDVGKPASVLTLEDVTRLALEHDPRLQAAAARVRSALADARQARLLPNPVLSVAFRFPEGGGKPTIEAALSEDLLSLLTRPKRSDAADQRVRAASADVLQAALDVVADVQQRYIAAQSLDQRLAVLRQREDLVRRLLDLAQYRLQAGEAGRLDVITLDAERASLDADVIQRMGELRDQRLALARLIGRPSDSAGWSLTPWHATAPPGGDENAWITMALQHRPEIHAQRWELIALGDQAAIAGWGIFDGASAGLSAERDPDWTVGPAVTTPLPLFDWGQARRERAKALQVEARHKLTEVRRQVIEEVRRAYADVASARAVVTKVRRELVPLQQQRQEQAEAAYKAGAADITAVLLAEQQSQDIREQLVELEAKQATAFIQLQRAVGGTGVADNVHRSATRPSMAAATPTTQPEPQNIK